MGRRYGAAQLVHRLHELGISCGWHGGSPSNAVVYLCHTIGLAPFRAPRRRSPPCGRARPDCHTPTAAGRDETSKRTLLRDECIDSGSQKIASPVRLRRDSRDARLGVARVSITWLATDYPIVRCPSHQTLPTGTRCRSRQKSDYSSQRSMIVMIIDSESCQGSVATHQYRRGNVVRASRAGMAATGATPASRLASCWSRLGRKSRLGAPRRM